MSTPHQLMAAYNAGQPLDTFSADERLQLRQAIVAEPAYHDRKHEHHGMLVEDARALYAMDAPEEDA